MAMIVRGIRGEGGGADGVYYCGEPRDTKGNMYATLVLFVIELNIVRSIRY